jgi:hypothetical protein
MFAPERWGQVERFRHFWSTTYSFDERQQRALAGVDAHFVKSVRLQSLASELRPKLEIDRAQLDQQGYTPAENGAELATVIEAAILELYSSIDCTVKVLRAVYGSTTRGFRDSTRSLFQAPNNLEGSFPDTLKTLIAGADWYSRLVHLRDELTHLATGSVHPFDRTGVVAYHHYGLKEGEKPLIVEDIFGWLKIMTEQVNGFLGAVFKQLNDTLEDKSIFQVCGMVEGRILHRYISPAEKLTFDSGSCGAWAWFELPGNPSCPFKDHCGAYLKKAPPQGWEVPAAPHEG